MLLVMGDFNAKVGRREPSAMSSAVELYGLGESNEAGEQLEDFCFEHELALANTMFKQHPRRRYTWTCPGGNTRNQIDYAFEMKGLRKILRVSWTAKKTNECVLNKTGVKREMLNTVKVRKLAYYGYTMRKQGSCSEKAIMQGTMPGAHRRGRPHTAWMDNIKTWTGLPVEESIRMTEGRDKSRKYIHGVANPRIADG